MRTVFATRSRLQALFAQHQSNVRVPIHKNEGMGGNKPLSMSSNNTAQQCSHLPPAQWNVVGKTASSVAKIAPLKLLGGTAKNVAVAVQGWRLPPGRWRAMAGPQHTDNLGIVAAKSGQSPWSVAIGWVGQPGRSSSPMRATLEPVACQCLAPQAADGSTPPGFPAAAFFRGQTRFGQCGNSNGICSRGEQILSRA